MRVRRIKTPLVMCLLGAVLSLPAAFADDLFKGDGALSEERALSGESSISADEILPVDEAFRFGSYVEGESLKLFWQVLPGYYLYRDKFRFEQAGQHLAADLPRGKLYQDEIFGEVEVLSGLVEVTLPSGAATQVFYQGCAERGYCYPPQKKQLSPSK